MPKHYGGNKSMKMSHKAKKPQGSYGRKTGTRKSPIKPMGRTK